MNDEHTVRTTEPLRLSSAILRQMRADLVELGLESRALKARLRQRWSEPMGALQQRWSEVKRDTTHLLIALAASRGRFHVLQRPRLGSVPGSDEYYFRAPGAVLYSLVRWDPVAHRERVVRALGAIYDTPSALAAPQVSP